jgi:hypothetical protein
MGDVDWRREADPDAALRGPEAAAQQAREGDQLGGRERRRHEQMTEKKGR